MEINSKYGVNDDVWFCIGTDKPIKSKITGIKIDVSSSEISVAGERRDLIKTGNFKVDKISYSYDIKFNTHPFKHPSVAERFLFDSIEQLKENLINRINSF